MKNNIPNIESSNNSFLTAKTAGFLVGLKEKNLQKDAIIQNITNQESTTNNETINNVEENSIVQDPTQIFNAPLIGENVSVAIKNPAITNPEIQENNSNEENSVTDENVTTETEIINPEIQENISNEENSVIEENVPTETEIINPEIQENNSNEENSVTVENTSTETVVVNPEIQENISTEDNSVIEENVPTETVVVNPETQENISNEDNSVIEENVPTETVVVNPEIQENISNEDNSVTDESVPTETEIINPEIQENISTEENSVTDESVPTETVVVNPEIQENISNEDNSVTDENVPTETEIINPEIQENISTEENSVTDESVPTETVVVNPEIQENISTEDNSGTDENVPTETEIINPEIQENISTEDNSVTDENVPTETEIINPEIQENISTEENSVTEENASTETVVVNPETQENISTEDNSVTDENTSTEEENNSEQTVNVVEKHTIDEVEEAENEFAVAPIIPSTPATEDTTVQAEDNPQQQEKLQEEIVNSNPSSIFNIPLIAATPTQESITADNTNTNNQETTAEMKEQDENTESSNVNNNSDNKATEQPTVETTATVAGLNTNIDYFNFEFKTSQPEKEEIKTELSLDEEAMKFDFNSVIREPENKGTIDTPTEKIDLDKFLEPKENLIKKAEEAEETDNNVIRIKEDNNAKSQNGRKYLLYGFYVLLLIVAIFFCIKLYKNSTNFSLTRTEITLAINSTYQAEVVSNSKIQDNKKYQWTTSNDNVVTVDENGLITSVGGGEATIFVERGSNKQELKVTAIAIEITSIAFKDKELTLKVGDEKTLQAIINDDESIVIDLIWESSDTNVITVDENGHVVAVGEGTAYVQVYDDISGKAGELKVTVTPSKNGDKPAEKPEEPTVDKEKVEVTGVALNKSDLIMEVDEYVVVSAVVRPANATDKKVTWSSSNKNVATVSSTGKITARAEGTATITAKTTNGKKASLKVTVTKKFVKVTGVTLNKETATLDVGESLTLNATVAPKNATNPKVTWATSDASVATVNNGKVTAKAPGTATITVTSSDGNKKAVCTITVKEKVIIKVDKITLSEDSIELITGNSKTITATVTPDNATDKTVNWSTSNADVATVSNGKITAKGAGTATITATSSDGSQSATCTVKVTDPIVEATGVSLNKTQITLKVGETFQLNATIKPSNTSNKKLTWTSLNDSIATVDENGLVTAVKAGSKSTVITVKTSNGKKATCSVIVEEATVTPDPEPETTPES